MDKFKILIEETLTKEVEIEATNLKTAIEKVEAMYKNCEIVLSADDFKCIEILVID